MRESVLQDYFLGLATPAQLQADVKGAFVQRSSASWELRVERLGRPATVRVQDVIKLCRDVELGYLDPDVLEAVGFSLLASDDFDWPAEGEDVERMAEVLHDWSAPQINYALTAEAAGKWRHYLETGHNTFVQADCWNDRARAKGTRIRGATK